MKITNPVRKYLSDIGRMGGKKITEAKSNASRLNGLKGGRPKKQEHHD